jgi:altronate dehydratase large subunit
MSVLTGYRRADGRAGVRNHLLVLPSVVCSSHAARQIAGEGRAIAIAHQHGCLHVGEDLGFTRAELIGAAVSPNVAAAVVVSLGCETIDGRGMAEEIARLGQQVELVGIQAAGGTRRAVQAGRDALARLTATVAQAEREPLEPAELAVGIDIADERLADTVAGAVRARGIGVQRAPAGRRGAEAHVALAQAGAQLIVSLPAPEEAPIGFAVCPVVALARDSALHFALRDDFDLLANPAEDDEALAERIVDQLLRHAAGEPTAAERRGARDFVLHRLAVTM